MERTVAEDISDTTLDRLTRARPRPSARLELVNQIGMRLSLEVASLDEAYAKMRQYGGDGWTSGEVPDGGYMLPYGMAETFDFSLIGAKTIQVTENDGRKTDALLHRGRVYKRRDLEEVESKSKKMPAAIKYSRSAAPTDPPHLKEGDPNGVAQYVTLITFKGRGEPIRMMQKR